jgi:hypothetical protein
MRFAETFPMHGQARHEDIGETCNLIVLAGWKSDARTRWNVWRSILLRERSGQ